MIHVCGASLSESQRHLKSVKARPRLQQCAAAGVPVCTMNAHDMTPCIYAGELCLVKGHPGPAGLFAGRHADRRRLAITSMCTQPWNMPGTYKPGVVQRSCIKNALQTRPWLRKVTGHTSIAAPPPASKLRVSINRRTSCRSAPGSVARSQASQNGIQPGAKSVDAERNLAHCG